MRGKGSGTLKSPEAGRGAELGRWGSPRSPGCSLRLFPPSVPPISHKADIRGTPSREKSPRSPGMSSSQGEELSPPSALPDIT